MQASDQDNFLQQSWIKKNGKSFRLALAPPKKFSWIIDGQKIKKVKLYCPKKVQSNQFFFRFSLFAFLPIKNVSI